MRRVVVDTNVWVSAAIEPAGPSGAVASAFALGRFHLLLSEPLLAELSDVLRRPRLIRCHRRPSAEIDQLLADLCARCEWVSVSGQRGLCRDPNDDVVMETALNGAADILVTGDADFLGSSETVEAARNAGLWISSPREFAELLESEGAAGAPDRHQSTTDPSSAS